MARTGAGAPRAGIVSAKTAPTAGSYATSSLTTQPGSAQTIGPSVSLSVIVVTHNRADLALATLESARAAAKGLDVQWLVIDSGSTDGTPQSIEERFADIRVTRCENIGFAAANNKALGLAHGRYVLLLNPDVEVASGTFADLLAALDERPQVGIASVIQRGSDGRLQSSIRSYPSPRRAFGEALALPWRGWREEQQGQASYLQERQADWLVGAFLIARAETIEQIGGLDERFFLYSEETDWCYRARAAGWDVRHLPHMTVTHHCTPSTRPELVAQLSYAKLLFARKHYRRPQSSAVRGALSVRHLLRMLGLTVGSRRDGRPNERLAAERHALAVMIGIAQPPFR
jgi:N-acetylglucosaminyl-diphospho-decaprenol L-rhamnosyltransferase